MIDIINILLISLKHFLNIQWLSDIFVDIDNMSSYDLDIEEFSEFLNNDTNR